MTVDPLVAAVRLRFTARPRKEESYVASLSASSRLIHSAIWFQLANVRITTPNKRLNFTPLIGVFGLWLRRVQMSIFWTRSRSRFGFQSGFGASAAAACGTSGTSGYRLSDGSNGPLGSVSLHGWTSPSPALVGIDLSSRLLDSS